MMKYLISFQFVTLPSLMIWPTMPPIGLTNIEVKPFVATGFVMSFSEYHSSKRLHAGSDAAPASTADAKAMLRAPIGLESGAAAAAPPAALASDQGRGRGAVRTRGGSRSIFAELFARGDMAPPPPPRGASERGYGPLPSMRSGTEQEETYFLRRKWAVRGMR
jgi:hypothetical protein